MPKDAKSATLKIRPETKDRLAEYGKKSETFDAVIERLLNEVEAPKIEDVVRTTTSS